jgi:hypothetical protein
VFTSFAFPFANFFQPGVFWPALADIRPMQIIAMLALAASFARRPTYNRLDAVAHPATKWLLLFLFIQVLSVYRSGVSAMLDEFKYWSAYGLFVLVSLRVISDPAALRSYVWGMMCGSAWIIFWGLYAVHAGLMAKNGGRAGAYGMYENHNDYSFIIVQALPFFYIYWRNETGWLKRLFLLLATLASIVGVFLSLSRGGMIALVIEVVLIRRDDDGPARAPHPAAAGAGSGRRRDQLPVHGARREPGQRLHGRGCRDLALRALARGPRKWSRRIRFSASAAIPSASTRPSTRRSATTTAARTRTTRSSRSRRHRDCWDSGAS